MLYTSFPLSSQASFASAGLFAAQNASVHPRRVLDTYVLLFGCGGEYPISQDGEEFVLRDGSFLLLRAGVEHWGSAPARGNQSHFWCHFYLPCATVGDVPSADPSVCVLPAYFASEHAEKYRLLFRQLIDAEYRESANDAVRGEICNSFLRILLIELWQDLLSRQNGGAGGQSEAFVLRVKEWVRLHVCEGIAPSDVAAAFGYNADYLTRRFRQHTGMTVGDYILAKRLDEAKKLLISGNLQVGAVALQCGFRDEKYFLRAFKKSVGVTPSQYRSSFCRVHENHF